MAHPVQKVANFEKTSTSYITIWRPQLEILSDLYPEFIFRYAHTAIWMLSIVLQSAPYVLGQAVLPLIQY